MGFAGNVFHALVVEKLSCTFAIRLVVEIASSAFLVRRIVIVVGGKAGSKKRVVFLYDCGARACGCHRWPGLDSEKVVLSAFTCGRLVFAAATTTWWRMVVEPVVVLLVLVAHLGQPAAEFVDFHGEGAGLGLFGYGG